MLYLQNLLNPSPTGQDDYVADSQTLTEVWMSTVEIKLFLRSERKRCMQWALRLEFSLIVRDTLAFQDEALPQDMQKSIHAVVQKVYIPAGIVGNKAVLD